MFGINANTGLKHYKFPEIGQYAAIIANINRRCTYVGYDENGDPIYDQTLPKPKLKFLGTTKLHGTNAGIIIDFHNEVIYFESRDNIIIPGADNAGFAAFLSNIQNEFIEMVKSNIDTSSIDWENNVLAIYGEWCGGNIQKKVALNNLSKMFVIFNVAVRTRENTESRNIKWLNIEEIKKLKLTSNKVYNIYDFQTWEIEIDFNKHFESTNSIIEMTIAVEDECPVSKALGSSGIGEGIVFRCITEPYVTSEFWFKSKGEKHANQSKVKTLNPVDDEKINRLMTIADKVTPSWRLEQMFNNTFDILNGGIITREKLGHYLKSVNQDIEKEEKLTLEAEGIIFKDIANYVSKISRDYFFQVEKDMLTNPQQY